ncbi:MAG: Modification methylase PstI [uncultured Gemmatimonadetes bacterium]|uniref:site-specific DNA-methyltransferase (adenine-specific) n=1 Tax=uncultured Gemmatimonadota bacterium TaxID=203437 RepID=A0A6J4MEW7_9BACT|nr:MAG: Modification methylase PstI [uncultured Gemmatimonadota bacterium]
MLRGQYMTPYEVAELMAGLINITADEIRILEPGAGIGSLIAAAVEFFAAKPTPPRVIKVTAYEREPILAMHLEITLRQCAIYAKAAGIHFESQLIRGDFIKRASRTLDVKRPEYKAPDEHYNLILTNPPYRKLRSDSLHARLLRRQSISATNLYTAFVSLAIRLARPGAEIIALIPRSFCNGPFFRGFRKLLLRDTAICRLHVFESRSSVFKADSVLQENVILKAVRSADQGDVVVSCANGSPGSISSEESMHKSLLIWEDDPGEFIHIVLGAEDKSLIALMRRLPTTLADLGVEVSTGRVVDFRALDHLRRLASPHTAPLIYPGDLVAGHVVWPHQTRKPNSVALNEVTKKKLLLPSGNYVLVKRFTAKEERRRVVAAVYNPDLVLGAESPWVGFENHLNYYHSAGAGISAQLAYGLMAYLNTSLVDRYSRLYSGHTQVNVTDLRSLRYPTLAQLLTLGSVANGGLPEQHVLDQALGRVLESPSL